MYLDTLEDQIIKTVEEQGYSVKSCNAEADFNSEKDIGIKKINLTVERKEGIKKIEKVEIGTNKKTSQITQSQINDLKEYLSKYYEIDKGIIIVNAN